MQLYTAIERRIQTLKRDQQRSKEDDDKKEKSDEKIFSKKVVDDDHKERKNAEKEKLAKQTTLPDSPSESEKD